MRTTQAFLKAKLIIRGGQKTRKTIKYTMFEDFRQHWANRYAPKVINHKCFTQNGVTFRQRYSVASNKTSWNVAIRHHNVEKLTHN